MELLDKTTEQLLQEILSKKIKNVDEKFCSKCQIDALVQGGYVTYIDSTTFSGWSGIIAPTQKGVAYFDRKKKYKRLQLWEKLKNSFKFWFTVFFHFVC